jgi:hypothetical protein
VSPLWLIAGLVWLVGTAAVLALLRETADEARMLNEELLQQREIGTSLGRLHESIRVLEGRIRGRR